VQGVLHKYLLKQDTGKAGSLMKEKLLEKEVAISLSKHLFLFNKRSNFPHFFYFSLPYWKA